MSAQSPYVSPMSDVQHGLESTESPKFFSLSQRLGRLRYFSYSMAMFVLLLLVVLLLLMIASVSQSIGLMAFTGFIYVVGAVFVGAICGVRRLHDLDKPGWLMLLMLIPVINFFLGLYLLFAPGTQGENSYGPRLHANPGWLWVLAVGIPVALTIIIGILSAIAVPAYQEYLMRAGALG